MFDSNSQPDSDEEPIINFRPDQYLDDYPLTRSRSVSYNQEGNVVRLKERLVELEKTIAEMKWRIDQMEESTGAHIRWGVRYSQRMAILANVLLGLWHFWIEFVDLIQKRRRVIVQSFLQKQQTSNQLNSVVSDAYQFAAWRSSIFFICALLIFSKSNWKRVVGIFLSCFASFYFSPKHPTANYFTLFANLLHGTAAWSLSGKTTLHSRPQRFWEQVKKTLLNI